jgi:hypothetical protein
MRATNLSEGLLVYGESEPSEETFELVGERGRLFLRSLDLSVDPERVLSQIGVLAEFIRSISEIPFAAQGSDQTCV